MTLTEQNHKKAYTRPGLQPGLQLARIMECGLTHNHSSYGTKCIGNNETN